MPITINLKQLEYIDGDNLKLDKVNYNFDQLVANGGGPQGTTGYQGTMGYQGTTGYQGFQGDQGDQGFQGNVGPAGGEFWIKKLGVQNDYTADTLLPANDATINDSAPVVKIGYISTDAQYAAESAINPATGQLPAQFIVNRKSYFGSNISLTTDGTSNSFDFKLESTTDAGGAVTTTLSQGFSEITNIGLIKIFANSHEFWENTTGTQLIKVSETETVFTKQVTAQNDVTVSKDLSIQTTYSGSGEPALNKIATSADASGKLKFQTIQELGGGIPVGTIVGVLSSVFEQSSNFIQQQLSYDASSGAIEFTIGRGIGDYVGWYLCNGQVWKDTIGVGIGTISYNVPDLNGYDYTIDDNTNSITGQGVATTNGAAKKSIMGGADIELDADYTGSNQYDITHTNNYVEDLVQPDGTATPYAIKKVPQVIYLGETDLFFQIPGEPSPTYTNNYEVVFGEITPTYGNVTYIASSNLFSVSAPVGSITTPQTFQLQMDAPLNYAWTANSYDPDWTLPTGVTISAPTYGGTFTANGYESVQYTITVSSQLASTPSNIQITFDVDLALALTLSNTQTNTYIYNTGATTWTYSPASQTKTEVISTTVVLDPVTLTAVAGKYFNTSQPPGISYVYYGTGGTATRTADIEIDSYSFSTGTQPTQLTITPRDIDFANTSAVPSGITVDTTIAFSASVYDMLPQVSPSGGQMTGNTYSTSATHSQSFTVTNNTGSTIYVTTWLQNFTNSSPSNNTTILQARWNNSTYTTVNGPENSTQNDRSSLTSIANGGTVTSNMDVNITSTDSTWFAKLMWTDNPAITTNPWDTPSASNGWNVFF